MTRIEVDESRANLEQQAATLFTQASSEYPACLFGGAISIALAIHNNPQVDAAQLMHIAQTPNPVWERVARAANTRHTQSGLNAVTVPGITPERAQEMAFDFFRLANDIKDVPSQQLRQFLGDNYPTYVSQRRAAASKSQRDELQMQYVNRLRQLAGLAPARSATEQAQENFYTTMMGDRGYE